MAVILAKKATSLLEQLSEPVSVFEVNGTSLQVYRIKDMHSLYWNNSALKSLFILCRSSYGRYGARSEIDEFDAKAAIYLVRATYFLDQKFFEEWLSIRMVPGDGYPIGGGELETYIYNGKTLDQCVRERFSIEDRDSFWDYIVSSSRMCGIRPYVVENGQVLTDLSTEVGGKHKHTNISFALIHWHFVKDYPDYKYQLVTAIIRDDLALKGLFFTANNKKSFGPLFTSAHVFLGVKQEEIKLNQKKHAYKFPLYWFNRKQMLQLLENLLETSKLSEESLLKYTGSRNFAEPESMRKLGTLLSVEGLISGSTLTGDELRKLVDDFVTEQPSLKITDSQSWNEANQKTLLAAGVIL